MVPALILMSRTLSEFEAQIQPLIRDTTGGTVTTNDIRDSLNRCISHMIKDHGIYATKNKSILDVFTGVYEYPTPSDFFDVINIQRQDSPRDYLRVKPEDFWSNFDTYSEVLSVDTYRTNHSILFKTSDISAVQVINDCDSLTANGTWAAEGSTDASNVTLESVNMTEGSGAISFDVVVGGSGNDYAAVQNSTMTQVDLTDYANKGTVFIDLYIPSVTALSSITLRWGNDSSNYYSRTVTAQFNGNAFRVGVNTLGFAWSGSTETGSVTDTTIDYLNVRVTYTASYTSQTGFILDNIRVVNPYRMSLRYYSTYFVVDAAGAYATKFSAITDSTLLDNADDDVLYYYALADAYWIKESPNDRVEALRLHDVELSKLKTRYNSEKKREVSFYR